MMNCEMNHVAPASRANHQQRSGARECILLTAWVSFAPLAVLAMFLLSQLR